MTDIVNGTMTLEEMDALPLGTKVRITWIGGNGPWDYVVYKHFGYTGFVTEKDPNVVVGWPSQVQNIEIVKPSSSRDMAIAALKVKMIEKGIPADVKFSLDQVARIAVDIAAESLSQIMGVEFSERDWSEFIKG